MALKTNYLNSLMMLKYIPIALAAYPANGDQNMHHGRGIFILCFSGDKR